MSEKVKNEVLETKNENRVSEVKEKGVSYSPDVDIREYEGRFEILADIPGAKSDTVEITIEKNELTIEAAPSDLRDLSEYGSVYREFRRGSYRRSFKLNDEIDRDNIVASVRHGQLRLTLPKATPAKTRINVQGE